LKKSLPSAAMTLSFIDNLPEELFAHICNIAEHVDTWWTVSKSIQQRLSRGLVNWTIPPYLRVSYDRISTHLPNLRHLSHSESIHFKDFRNVDNFETWEIVVDGKQFSVMQHLQSLTLLCNHILQFHLLPSSLTSLNCRPLHLNLERGMKLPVMKLPPNLKSLKVDRIITDAEFGLADLPRGLVNLEVDWIYWCRNNTSPNTPPQLESLSTRGIQEKWLLKLPSSLTDLKIDSDCNERALENNDIDEYGVLISSLPRNLTAFDLTTRGLDKIQDYHIGMLPPKLTRFRLRAAEFKLGSFTNLPKSILHLSIMSVSETPQTNIEPFFRHLPPRLDSFESEIACKEPWGLLPNANHLTSLHLYNLKISSEDGEELSTLPVSLTCLYLNVNPTPWNARDRDTTLRHFYHVNLQHFGHLVQLKKLTLIENTYGHVPYDHIPAELKNLDYLRLKREDEESTTMYSRKWFQSLPRQLRSLIIDVSPPKRAIFGSHGKPLRTTHYDLWDTLPKTLTLLSLKGHHGGTPSSIQSMPPLLEDLRLESCNFNAADFDLLPKTLQSLSTTHDFSNDSTKIDNVEFLKTVVKDKLGSRMRSWNIRTPKTSAEPFGSSVSTSPF
jgi:hypothetical protein